jgi:hypothetical protein
MLLVAESAWRKWRKALAKLPKNQEAQKNIAQCVPSVSL